MKEIRHILYIVNLNSEQNSGQNNVHVMQIYDADFKVDREATLPTYFF